MDQSTFKESFKVAAEQLVDAVKKLLHEGNVRRIVIKQEGRTVAEFPLTVGVVGAVVAPGPRRGRRPGRGPHRVHDRSKSNGRTTRSRT